MVVIVSAEKQSPQRHLHLERSEAESKDLRLLLFVFPNRE